MLGSRTDRPSMPLARSDLVEATLKPLSVFAATGVMCLLPAVELTISPLDLRARGPATGIVIPTFVPGCELIPPRVSSVYTGKGHPRARRDDARIEVFLAGERPNREFVVVGELEVATGNRNTSLSNLIEYARREARRLGGDAIVDVRPPASTDRPGKRVLTAKVVSWV